MCVGWGDGVGEAVGDGVGLSVTAARVGCCTMGTPVASRSGPSPSCPPLSAAISTASQAARPTTSSPAATQVTRRHGEGV